MHGGNLGRRFAQAQGVQSQLTALQERWVFQRQGGGHGGVQWVGLEIGLGEGVHAVGRTHWAVMQGTGGKW